MVLLQKLCCQLKQQSIKRSLFIVIVCLSITSCSKPKTILVEHITQEAANNVIYILGTNNISAEKAIQKDGTYIVTITKSDQIKALGLLQNNGAPQKDFATFGEVFKKDSFISSPLEEQGRFLYALNQEISGMLSQIDGVISVKTEVSLPQVSDSLWQTEQAKPSASVLIKYKPGYRVYLYVNRIKQLVSNAVPGLTPDRVEVLTITERGSE